MWRHRRFFCFTAGLILCLAFQSSINAQSNTFNFSSASCCPDSQALHFDESINCGCCPVGTFSAFIGIDGSKQPQDFGVNANLGGRARINFSAPLIASHGIGFQIGTAVGGSGNAVQVYELLGESKDRFQSFTTVGVFQRTPSGFSWGAVYDYLYQESYDQFNLGQWRFRASFEVTPKLEVGTTLNFSSQSDQGLFNNTLVTLEPIEMLNIYFQREWETGVLSKFWVGVADGHDENNAVTGSLPRKQNQFLFGADIFAPLNNWMAIYGETNLMMPADTGTVDAFLGIEVVPGGIWKKYRQNRFRSMLPVASNPSFSTDLLVR